MHHVDVFFIDVYKKTVGVAGRVIQIQEERLVAIGDMSIVTLHGVCMVCLYASV
jgi:hypothetical protein